MKNKKKVILILAILSLIFFLASTAYTYAKYYTKENGTIGSHIKKWDIKINNESIRTGTVLSNKITAYIDANENIARNKIAPGTYGYFLIDVDYTNVDLSFSYDISIEVDDTISDIESYMVEVDGEEYEAVDGHIVGTIDVAAAGEKRKEIKVYLRWNDEESAGATMDNEEDTQVTIDYESIDFNVAVQITQLAD